jgi:hypothetical protein
MDKNSKKAFQDLVILCKKSNDIILNLKDHKDILELLDIKNTTSDYKYYMINGSEYLGTLVDGGVRLYSTNLINKRCVQDT